MMIRLRRIGRADTDFHDYGADILRVQNAVQRNGYECSPTQAKELWEEYSDSMCAGWMGLPEDEYLFACVAPYIKDDES